MSSDFIQSWTEGAVGVIQLNRPKVANALNRQMVQEIVEQAERYDRDQEIRVILVKGSERAFAAGADIREMEGETPIRFELADPFADWDRFTRIHKPMVAAVNGFALGGGFELALHCDLIVAATNARFGFPEVSLGVLPGAGGTQLLTSAVGRKKALEWIWTGKHISAQEALQIGIINKIVEPELVEEEAFRLARTIVKQAPIAVRLIKEAVHQAEDVTLADGMMLERKNFYLAFATKDQKEGMKAFLEKRPPIFKGE
ncbi:enoyl-CoA hydratase-related protein [Halalkalibacterium halodurans]|uniref:enoyl-CoA hydratase-related protein n=1 Tax=Halalkalibacterium halodurans TaxID=86665 RepID=UPI002AA99F59|nr:enoyl-CoA hydratase-related protein [Halalkalibacterium halodurans]MDY7220709.1 enoyl-CoA hydratase-related protein [Halalkalibacterium halodurans]MDY7239948.1 enoyl-CoA hydratase-related protein [Halalkalibacterium halodurans]